MAHHHHYAATGRVLLVSLLLTAAFVVVEALAGLRAGSLALLSDAGHNFADAFALLLAGIGFYLQSRPANQVKTFGYQRAGVLVAFINAVILVALAGLLFYESYRRLMHPRPVAAMTMLAIAGIGLLMNSGVAWGLGAFHGNGSDLNLRAAWMHMLGDAASSAGIIAGAIAIHYTGWLQIDPALSILIGIAIVGSAWNIIRESLNILLEGLPKGLKLSEVARNLCQVPGVVEVHDLHIWSLGSEAHALSVLLREVAGPPAGYSPPCPSWTDARLTFAARLTPAPEFMSTWTLSRPC